MAAATVTDGTATAPTAAPLREPYAPPTQPICILYRDAWVLAVDKPAGLLSVPGKGAELADCLIARLQAILPDIRLVHRLDRDTSGVILFALLPESQRHLGLQFERRHMQKTYVAQVSGWPSQETGTIDLPLRADWPNRPRQQVHPEGKTARTHWRVIRRAPDRTTRLELTPQTGRSHQLRVHLSAIGHPILGDPLYHPCGRGDASRLMLHASRLCLRHPMDGRRLSISAPSPF